MRSVPSWQLPGGYVTLQFSGTTNATVAMTSACTLNRAHATRLAMVTVPRRVVEGVPTPFLRCQVRHSLNFMLLLSHLNIRSYAHCSLSASTTKREPCSTTQFAVVTHGTPGHSCIWPGLPMSWTSSCLFVIMATGLSPLPCTQCTRVVPFKLKTVFVTDAGVCRAVQRHHCFAEPTCADSTARVLTFLGEDRGGMTIEKCASWAAVRGFRYSAVQWYFQCYGGNDISRYTQPGTCNTPCDGNRGQACGGGCSNSIFVVPGKPLLL